MGMDFDDILSRYVGTFGKYQRIKVVVLMVVLTPAIVHTGMSSVFLAATPRHHCEIKPQLKKLNCHQQVVLDYALPKVTKSGHTDYDKCRMYTFNQTLPANLTSDTCELLKDNSTGLQAGLVQCEQWHYDLELYGETVVTEWDLVCDRTAMATNTAGLFMAARLFGTFACGWLIDRFGRKSMGLICGLTEGVAFLVSAFVPSYLWFSVLRGVMGFFNIGFGSAFLLIAIEMVGPKHRNLINTVMSIGWSLNYAAMAGTAFVIKDWRRMCLIYGGYQILVVVLLFFFLSESPRWLLSKQRYKEAWECIKIMAKTNSAEIPHLEELKIDEKKKTTNLSHKHLFKTPGIRWLTLNCGFIWIVASFVYYGISLNSSELGGNPYINFFISGLVELPAYLGGFWLCHRFGRLPIFCMSFIVSGSILLISALVPADISWAVVTLGMLGKMFNCIAFQVVYLVTTEVYSTPIRAMGFFTCSAVCRLGSTFGAYVILLENVHRALPLLVFAMTSFVAGVMTLLLPETRGVPLMETVQECEQFITSNSCKFCKSGRNKREVVNGKEEDIFL